MIGYARVSTDEQRLDLQLDALKKGGCKKIYTDQGVSGRSLRRPGLNRALEALTTGNVLVVWRLDRLGRSLSNVINVVELLSSRGIGFISLTEGFDTTNGGGRFMFHIMAALAEFERGLISDRTKAGLASARSRGARLGRPPLLSPHKIRYIADKLKKNEGSITEHARELGVSNRTLQHHLKKVRDGNGSSQNT